MSYLGKVPGVPGGVRQVYEFIATEGQTVFSGVDRNGLTLDYTAGFANISVGGVQISQEDYAATNGASVTILTPIPAGRIVQVEAFGVFNQANMLPLTGGALTGLTTGVTPAQFDNSTKLATTAFVQKNGLVFKDGGRGIVVNTALTANDVGGFVEFSATGLTATLPAIATVTIGSTITFRAYTWAGTIKGSGSENIVYGLTGGVNTCTISPGETVTVVSNGLAWYTVANGLGTASFASSVAGNGYQKLPSGLIIQWGATSFVTATTTVTKLNVALPITFPTDEYALNITRTGNLFANNAPVVSEVADFSNAGAVSSFNISCVSGSGSTTNNSWRWIAIGS